MLPDMAEVLSNYPEVSSIHPAAELFPLPGDEDFAALVASIRKDGLENDIVLLPNKQLLDGRSRLLACWDARVEPRFTVYSGTDPYEYSVRQNLSRRHLDVGQKAMIGDKLRAVYEEQARERLRQAQEKGRATQAQDRNSVEQVDSGNISSVQPKPERAPQARDLAGAAAGVSGRSLDKARAIREFAPHVAPQVERGTITLEAGYKEAQKAKSVIQARPVEVKPVDTAKTDAPKKPDIPMVRIVKLNGEFREFPKKTESVFNPTNKNVDWAKWTWNPVTGCHHGCSFCYAREIANNERMAQSYPFAFEPAFHEYRLDAPKNTSIPNSNDPRDGRVFVCSMADLFGKWVPDEWIQKVFQSCLASPKWEYLFLTKWPARYAKMPLISRAWYGSSVIQQSDVERVERCMLAFDAPDCVKWISLEPMLEPIRFNDLSWADLVVIGSQTSTNQPEGYVPEFAPEFDWIVDVINQCREFGVPYYLKPNLESNPGMSLPRMTPKRKV